MNAPATDAVHRSLFTEVCLLAVAVLLPLLGLLAWNAWDRLEHQRGEALAVAGRLARFTATDTEGFLHIAEGLLAAAARHPAVATPSGRDCDAAYAAFGALAPAYAGYVTADAQGRVVCSGGLPEIGRLPGGARVPLPPAADRARFWVGRAQPDGADGWIVPLAQPLRPSQGAAGGVATVRLHARQFRTVVAGARLPEGSVAGILDGAGHPIMRTGDSPALGAGFGLAEAQAALGAGEEGALRASGEDGGDWLYGFARVAGTDWVAFSALPAAPFQAAALGSLRGSAAAGLAALVLAIALATAFGRRLLRRAADAARPAAGQSEAEACLRELQHFSADWHWETDAEHRFARVDGPAFEAAPILKDVLGKRRWELPGYAPLEESWAAFQARLARREPFRDIVFRLLTPEGEIRYPRASGAPVFDAAGAFAGYRGVATDATHEIAQRLSLRESERRYRELFDKNHLINLLADPDSGRIVDASEEACAFFGHSRALLVSLSLDELGLCPRDGQPPVADFLRAAGDVTTLLDWQARDGRLRVLEAHTGEIEVAGSRLLLATLHDVTARLQAEDRLRTLARAVEQSPASIVITDTEGKIEYINPRCEELTGYALAEVLGRNPRIFQSGLTPKAVYEELWQALMAGGEWRGELCNRSKAGKPYWEYAVIAPVLDEGGRIAHFIAVKEDITERKRREAEIIEIHRTLDRRVAERTADLERANRELDAFSYSVSHDLRAPLRAINGFAHLIEECDGAALSAEGRGHLERVRRNALHMGELIDDMLRFSRIGRGALDLRKVSPGETAAEVVRELQGEFPRAVATVAALPEAVCDPAMLKQVFANLIGNAFKYSARRADARIEVGAREEGGETIYFVRDNGAGFDMQYAQRLFGVFQRLHKESEFPGTGVGLATVKRIVERHGGRIWAEAAPGAGATFHFTLGKAA
ncbi:MAG: PAS domain S-box protein [Rhodocyclaceae bacterium]|nr:PAS domain S-box protein [Rhodocyclaceae bacterium]